MLRILTDSEAVEHADALIAKVADAMVITVRAHPTTSIEALSQILFMVNGEGWMSGSDMARAREAARRIVA